VTKRDRKTDKGKLVAYRVRVSTTFHHSD